MTARYITQMSGRPDAALQLYDTQTGTILGHYADPVIAEKAKDYLNDKEKRKETEHRRSPDGDVL